MITWLLDNHIHADEPLRDAAISAGHRVVYSEADFDGDGALIYHGNLSDVARLYDLHKYNPGVFYHPKRYLYSDYAMRIGGSHLLNHDWTKTTIRELIDDPDTARMHALVDFKTVFVRPNSPLKPFGGRLVDLTRLSYTSFDFGFYHEDPDLEIIVSSPKTHEIVGEYRFVVCGHNVVSGCQYVSRRSNVRVTIGCTHSAWTATQRMLNSFKFDNLFTGLWVVDVCEVQDQETDKFEHCILEVNPFSGAELYACDCKAVVHAAEEVVSRS